MTPAEFKILMPQFSAENDLRIQMFIDRSAPYFDVERWAGFYDDGVMYWVAHNLALANSTALSGTTATNPDNRVAEKRVGDVVIKYQQNQSSTPTSNSYTLTTYGNEYLRLARMVGKGTVWVQE